MFKIHMSKIFSSKIYFVFLSLLCCQILYASSEGPVDPGLEERRPDEGRAVSAVVVPSSGEDRDQAKKEAIEQEKRTLLRMLEELKTYHMDLSDKMFIRFNEMVENSQKEISSMEEKGRTETANGLAELARLRGLTDERLLNVLGEGMLRGVEGLQEFMRVRDEEKDKMYALPMVSSELLLGALREAKHRMGMMQQIVTLYREESKAGFCYRIQKMLEKINDVFRPIEASGVESSTK